jgi:predicted DsbA family dithiol-disulfide isomerase
VQEIYGDQVTFVGVAGRDELPAINAFINDLGVDGFDHAVDDDGAVWAAYGVNSQPAFVFIDDSGETTRVLGAQGLDSLTERLDDLTS